MATLKESAQIILKTCMNLQPTEKVLIATDTMLKDLAQPVFEEAKKITEHALFLDMEPRKTSGEEPTQEIAEAMKNVDVAVLMTKKSLSHTKARRDATEAGTRIASMPGVTREMMETAIAVDYKKMNILAKKLKDILNNASEARITTRLGTEVTMKLGGTPVYRDEGLYHKKGEWGNLPSGEACLAPVEGTTNGIWIIDESMSGVGKLENPIKITIKEGNVTKIEGAEEADKLRKKLEDLNDMRVFNIAELGIGTNDKAFICGSTLMDEKVIGTAHIAVGNNMSYGGSVDAPCHLDGVFADPTIVVDGKTIMENGKFLI